MSNEEMLWYSSFSTGIFEVDNQHGNIDMMIQMLDQKVVIEDPGKLEEILHALKSHFEYEESLLEERFPDEHRSAHEKFLTLYKSLIALVLSDSMSVARFIDVIRSELVDHAQTYDMKIKELL